MRESRNLPDVTAEHRCIGDAGVGVAVADQQDAHSGFRLEAPRLTQALDQAGSQVGHAARLDSVDGALDRGAVGDRSGGHHHLDLVVEDDETEGVGGGEAIDDVAQGALGVVERSALHGPTAVEDDHETGGGRIGAGGDGRRLDLHEHRGAVGGSQFVLHPEEAVLTEVCPKLHVRLLPVDCAYSVMHAADIMQGV